MAATKTYAQKRWSLGDMYPSDKGPEIKADFKKIEDLTADFEKLRPSLKEDIGDKDFLKAIQLLEQIHKVGNKLGSFAGLWFSEDTQNQSALALMAKTEQLSADLGNRTLFFGLWWKDLPEAAAARLMKNAGDYRYWLEEMRHFKPHTLSEAEEKIINTKNVTGINALTTLYETITNRYVFKVEVNGEKKELTRGELMALVRSSDPDLRAKAYQELYRVYGEDGLILGQMYQTVARDWKNEEVRK